MQFKDLVSLQKMSGLHVGGKPWGGGRALNSGQAALRRLEGTASCPVCPWKNYERRDCVVPSSSSPPWSPGTWLLLWLPTLPGLLSCSPPTCFQNTVCWVRCPTGVLYRLLTLLMTLFHPTAPGELLCTLWFQPTSHFLRPAFSGFLQLGQSP